MNCQTSEQQSDAFSSKTQENSGSDQRQNFDLRMFLGKTIEKASLLNPNESESVQESAACG